MIAKLKKGLHLRHGLLVTGAVALLAIAPVHATLTDVALSSVPAASLLPGLAQQAGDLTGLSVATDGNTMVVGVPQVAGKNLATAGVNLSLPLPLAPVVASGKAYVYERLNGVWIQVATLAAGNGADKDGFGVSVAVDGNSIVIGADAVATKRGAVYVFEKPLTGWSNLAVTNEVAQLAPLAPLPATSLFGHAVAIQGGTVVVGKWGSPGNFSTAATSAAYIFEKPVAGWASVVPHNEVAVLQPLVVTKNIVPPLPAAPVAVPMLTPPPYFGMSVAIDGNMIAVNGDLADKNNSAAYVFDKPATAGGWADLVPNANPSAALTFSAAALAIDNGSSGAQRLGFDIEISGNTIVASALHFDAPLAADAGAVFVYEKPAAGWPAPLAPALFPMLVENKMLTAPAPVTGGDFGRSVAVTPERILVGSFSNSLGVDPSIGFAVTGALAAAAIGTAYIFDKPIGVNASWATYNSLTNPAQTWQSPAGVLDDMFGYSVAAAKTTYIAGAWGLDTDLAPADLVLDMDVGSAAVKETTVDLVITNTLPAGTVPINASLLTYTITVANNDLVDTATNVVVTDSIPLGLTYVSATPTQGSCVDLNAAAPVTIPPTLPLIQCSLGSLLPNTSASIDLIVNVVDQTNVAHTASVTASESVVNSATTNNAANVAPTADAGLAQTVDEGVVVTLSGVGTDTAPGTVASYAWTQLTGDAVTLTGANTASASFTAPILSAVSVLPLQFQLTVTDDGGASATATVDISVTDISAPLITAPLGISVEATGTNTTVTAAVLGSATATDASAVTVSSDAPATFPIGNTTVNWTATDANGLNSSATQVVTVADSTAPTITAPAAVTVEAVGVTTAVTLGTPVTSDLFAVTVSSDAPATFPLGSSTVTWTATDANGNSNTATQLVTVQDTTLPTIIAPANMIVEATGVATAVVLSQPSSSDLFAVTVSSDAPATFPVGDTTVTWTATDANGLSSTVSQTVTVQDTTAPTLTLTGGDSLTPVGGTFSAPSATATDLVSGSVVVSDDRVTALNTAVGGSYDITFSATDAAGNTATKVHTVVVNALPVINGVPTASVVAGQSYSYALDATDANGDALTYSLLNAPAWLMLNANGVLSGAPTAADLGLHENITITVSDGNGSVTVGPFTVEVIAVAAASSGGGGGGGSLPLSFLAGLLLLGLRRRTHK
ncbi:MAG: HYR domain-containing protein [Gammaproteobacteria bacterium]|nr:HYR domain-containing protein [Gammaproteobacteria bacterium]